MPSFAITGTNRRAYEKFDYYPTTRCFNIENNTTCYESGYIKSRDYQPSPLANELIRVLSAYHDEAGA